LELKEGLELKLNYVKLLKERLAALAASLLEIKKLIISNLLLHLSNAKLSCSIFCHAKLSRIKFLII
jgi:hypothetical protein